MSHKERKKADLKEEKKNAEKEETFEASSAEEVKENATEETEKETADAPEESVETVESLKEQMKSMNDRYLRLMAEFDNFKKRTIRDYERMVDSANEKLILELVEVRENFERALKSGESSTNYESFYDGIKLIFNKFSTVLANNGLEPFAEAGDLFDPQDHDALMKMPHDTIPEEHIGEIYEKGYRLKGKVIKHAKVIVSSGKPEGSTDSKTDGE